MKVALWVFGLSLLAIFGLGGLAVLVLAGIGALLQKYGGSRAAQSRSEPPRARGWTGRAGRPPRGREGFTEPEDERGQHEPPTGGC